jgi:hypothetical protein
MGLADVECTKLFSSPTSALKGATVRIMVSDKAVIPHMAFVSNCRCILRFALADDMAAKGGADATQQSALAQPQTVGVLS